ncbi:MAG: hypothetical protein LUM44_08095 [Pyrinomonadaceae bacterium]|nr:hypothetical protein [Pyrinomonadaceae bacterium]
MKSIWKISSGLLVLLIFTAFARQNISFAQTADETLKVTANFRADKAVSPTTAIELLINRDLKPTEKISVTIDETDVSNLLAQNGNRFVYNSKLLPLPSGNSTLTVFSVEPNGNWNELARFSLVLELPTPAAELNSENPKSEPAAADGLNSENSNSSVKKETETSKPDEQSSETSQETAKTNVFNFLPSFTISMKSQPFQSSFPIEARPDERATFNDWTFAGSLKNEVKFKNFSSESNFDFAGSSFKPETLQFGTLGRKAHDIDLSSYLANFQVGNAKFSLGHTSFGNNRHLVSSFSSRGLSFNIPINKRFDVTAGILNGTSILGFGNFFGLGKIRHQMQGATLGIEFFPKRQSAMRLEISGFNGYLQALNGVSEGRIVDAEQSRGFGLRFLTSDKSERFKLEFGYALSQFFNPQDTTLDPDGNAIALSATTRSAHYAEASYQMFRDLKLSETNNLNLTFTFKYEFVEPLYRSLGASANADKFSHDYSLDGSIGEVTFQAGHARSNDNLRNVPSILKSLTRSNRFSVAFPIAALLKKSEKPSPFLPRIGYSFDRTRNFGAGIPVGGGFEIDISTIPDLVSANQTFSSAWQFKKFTAEYTYNRSFADNRQTGSENADQLGWVHGLTFGVNPLEILSFNVGINFDSQRNFEQNTINQNQTLTFGANWQPFKGATFAGNFSNSLANDKARTNSNRNVNYDVQFAYNFSVEKSKFRKFGMQAFARFADTFARNRDFVNELNLRTQTRIMTAGMTFNFF